MKKMRIKSAFARTAQIPPWSQSADTAHRHQPLFVPKRVTRSKKRWLNALKNHPTLLVSDDLIPPHQDKLTK